MTDVPVDGPEFDRWLAEADLALESARREAGAGAHNWACFLAEQSAQLAVKGLLHGLALAPWGHDLDGLGRSVAEAGLAVPEEISHTLARLGRHYIPARYPDAHAAGPAADHYTGSDSAEALSDAEAILAFVRTAWATLHG